MKTLIRCASILAAAALFSGCGAKGPLFIPEKPVEQEVPAENTEETPAEVPAPAAEGTPTEPVRAAPPKPPASIQG